MPNGEKKGITVRIDADLHAEVSQYLRDHSMTMAEFVSLALDDELHPKNQMKEGNTMANTRTIAVQVPEDLFQRIKDYLQRNNMTQRQFLIGLIEDELERDQTERESQNETVSDDPNQDEDDPEQNEDAALDDARTGLYYPYNVAVTAGKEYSGHAHSFEGVIQALLDDPAGFSIAGFEEFYSKQEQEMLLDIRNKLMNNIGEKASTAAKPDSSELL